jgi:hypothetical protein
MLRAAEGARTAAVLHSAKGGSRIYVVRDLDGYRIELIERG